MDIIIVLMAVPVGIVGLIMGAKRSRITRGIVAALLAWAVIAVGTWFGFFDGLLDYDPRYVGYVRLVKAVNAGDLTKAEQELKTTSPNLRPPYEDSEDYVCPLVSAVQNKNQAMVRLLLQHGADPNLGDVWEGCPLTYAAIDDDVPMMELLLQYRTTVQETKDSALWKAVLKDKTNAVRFLLAQGADPDQSCSPSLGKEEALSKSALNDGYPEIAAMLEKASKGKH
jgi:hypothetical protein